MIGYTNWVIELEEAKAAMIAAKKAVKAEAERRARKQAALEIRDAIQEIEHGFAKRLAQADAEGVPQAALRREVLRTGDWATWVKWRDLAGIEPERVVIEKARKAKAAAESPFRWADDFATLTVVRNSRGEDIEPVIYDMSTNKWNRVSNIWWPDTGTPEQNGISDAERAARKDDPKFSRFVSDEIARWMDTGGTTA